MPSPQPRIVSISLGTILKTIAVLVALGVAWIIRDILLYLFAALLLAGLIYPFARWAAAHKIPKGLAVIVLYLFLFGILALGFSLIIPILLEEARMLAGSYGKSLQWITEGVGTLRTLADRYGVATNLQTSVSGIQEQAQRAFGGLFSTLTDFFGGVAGFVVVLVLSFYMVVQDSALRNLFRNIIPGEYQEFASNLLWQVMEKLGSWLRGQLLLSLFISLMYFIGYTIIGVPYALLLAILGGLFEFIPYVGPMIAALPAIFLAFSASPARALATLILIIVIQQLESHVVIPKVMQKVVGLNPVVSIVAFMIGFRLFGFVGAVFAIPVATALNVALTDLIRFRRERTM